MKEPTETQQGRHSSRVANLPFVLAWVLANVSGTARAALPSIDSPPRSQTVILYQQAAFGVIASGTTSLSYQWRKDGVSIPGATNDQVILPHALWGSADIPPLMKSTDRSGADVNLVWDALPNRTYRVQYTTDLSANNWTDLGGDVAGTPTGTASKTDTTLAGANQRFYRVILLP